MLRSSDENAIFVFLIIVSALTSKVLGLSCDLEFKKNNNYLSLKNVN